MPSRMILSQKSYLGEGGWESSRIHESDERVCVGEQVVGIIKRVGF